MKPAKMHIHAPAGHYIGQVRRAGAKRWDTVTGRCRSPQAALAKAAKSMLGGRRARVLFIVDSGWYDPSITMEARYV